MKYVVMETYRDPPNATPLDKALLLGPYFLGGGGGVAFDSHDVTGPTPQTILVGGFNQSEKY